MHHALDVTLSLGVADTASQWWMGNRHSDNLQYVLKAYHALYAWKTLQPILVLPRVRTRLEPRLGRLWDPFLGCDFLGWGPLCLGRAPGPRQPEWGLSLP